MRILVDMDAIICDLLGKWLAVYNLDHDDKVTVEDIVTWDTHNHVKIGHKIYDYLRLDGWYDDLEPLPGAVEAFKTLQAGHKVKVVTSGSSADSARAKTAWCEKHLGIGKRDVIIMHEKHWLDADILIDDRPETIRNWHAKGKTVITIAYPYNAEVADLCALRAHDYRDTRKAWGEILNFIR